MTDESKGTDLKHPAVDSDPRKGLPPESDRIDFNDPTISGAEAVKRNLEQQNIETEKPATAEQGKA